MLLYLSMFTQGVDIGVVLLCVLKKDAFSLAYNIKKLAWDIFFLPTLVQVITLSVTYIAGFRPSIQVIIYEILVCICLN